MIQDRQYREVFLTFCSGGSSNILSHSCVPESFCGKRDTPHMQSKLMLRRKWVETKLHNGRKWVEAKLHNGRKWVETKLHNGRKWVETKLHNDYRLVATNRLGNFSPVA